MANRTAWFCVCWGKQPGWTQLTADTSASVEVIAGGGTSHWSNCNFLFPSYLTCTCEDDDHMTDAIPWTRLIASKSQLEKKKKLLTCEKSSFPQFVPILRGNAEVKTANAQSESEAEWAFTEQCSRDFFFFPLTQNSWQDLHVQFFV